MKIGHLDTTKNPILIAEVGNNHEGNVELAKKLITLAATAGADVVKFQTYKTENFVRPQDAERFEKLKKFELSYAEFETLHKTAQNEGILFLSTPPDLESAVFLNDLVPAFKIASGDNNFFPLIDKIISFKKPILLSGGLATLDELKYLKSYVESKWAALNCSETLAILHCVSAYPVPDNEANLLAIKELQTALGGVIGYSDHTIGITAAFSAFVLGAQIVEKHFTIDNNYSAFRDHQLSANPDDLTKLVNMRNQLFQMLGSGAKTLQKCEVSIKEALRRSIVAQKNIKKGAMIEKEDIIWMRPGSGITPGNEELVIGKMTHRDINQGETIRPEDLGGSI